MTDPRIHRDEHGARIVLADSLEYLKTLPDNSVDSVVTDPPYEIGFMGRGWDNTGIAYSVELWKECLRVLKPGGHALVFGATRTYHRVAVAIEDAGFEIRDSIHWMYGSGFPKSMAVDKAIEAKLTTGSSNKTAFKKLAGEQVDRGNWGIAKQQQDHGQRETNYDETAGDTRLGALAATTPEAQQWSGWGTALKPAHEPIVVARKPVEGTVAQNVLTYGVGGLNIDGSRVGRANGDISTGGFGNGKIGIGATGQDDNGARDVEWQQSTNGRFPANILLTHSAECEQVGVANETTSNHNAPKGTFAGGDWDRGSETEYREQEIATPVYQCVQGCPVAALDEQSGVLTPGHWAQVKTTGFGEFGEGKSEYLGTGPKADKGGASRFFTNTEHDLIDETDPFYYSAKAPKKERPVHPETGKGHPTVKPLEVMRWLIKLVTPAGGTVLEPFAGSGATVEAALLDGYKIIAIDITPDHMPLIDVRVDRVVDGTSPGLKVKPKKKALSAPQKPSTGPLTALDAAQVAMEALVRKKAPTALTLFEETDNA